MAVPSTDHFLERPAADNASDPDQSANVVVREYLLQKVPEFKELSRLRDKGWNNSKSTEYFKRQRENADRATNRRQKWFYDMMQRLGKEMDDTTQAFRIKKNCHEFPSVLDMCMAPGGMLAFVLERYWKANASCFSLPVSDGGHEVILPKSDRVSIKYCDLNLLAEDLGATDIPPDHPEVSKFLPRQLKPEQTFDLVLCDGQVLRTHTRGDHREKREARRLHLAQIALGLGHLETGGTAVILLHKVEMWDNVLLMYRFSKFSSIKLFKPRVAHTQRSSFYMICTNVQSSHPEAVNAIENWKREWRIATFGTDEDNREFMLTKDACVEQVLDQFGKDLILHGRAVWTTQAKALASASFMKGCARGQI